MYRSVKQITGKSLIIAFLLNLATGCSHNNNESSQQSNVIGAKEKTVTMKEPKKYDKNTLTVDDLTKCLSLKEKLDKIQVKVTSQQNGLNDLQKTMNDVNQKMAILKKDVELHKVDKSSSKADVKAHNEKVKQYNRLIKVKVKSTKAYDAAAKKYNAAVQLYDAQQAPYKITCVTNKHFYSEDVDAAKKKAQQ